MGARAYEMAHARYLIQAAMDKMRIKLWPNRSTKHKGK